MLVRVSVANIQVISFDCRTVFGFGCSRVGCGNRVIGDDPRLYAVLGGDRFRYNGVVVQGGNGVGWPDWEGRGGIGGRKFE